MSGWVGMVGRSVGQVQAMVSIGQCHTPPFCSVWQLGGFWGVRIVVFFSLPCQVVKYGLFSPFVLFLLTMDGYVVPFWSFFHGAPFLCIRAIRDGNTQPGHHLRWGLEFMCGHLEAKLFQEANGCVKVSVGLWPRLDLSSGYHPSTCGRTLSDGTGPS